jgi:hypothetical protein
MRAKTLSLSLSFSLFFVRVEGLEPPCREAPDPKSGMSTNFTIPAYSGPYHFRDGKDKDFFNI